MIHKLIGRVTFSNLNVKVDIVHGFQGGEKDIIIFIVNPEIKYDIGSHPKCNSTYRKAINKDYIINVGISRAKDCLIIMKASNIYQAPPKKYLISYDDNSIDIQIEPDYRENQ
jgi:superfamily I DNA and/or RNA helicase